MKVLFSTVFGILLFSGFVSAEVKPLKSDKEKLSYSMGAAMGMQLKRQGADVDANVLTRGLRDVLTNSKLQLTDQEMQTILTAFQKDMTAKQAEKSKKISEENKKEGAAFLAANKEKEGITTLPSGLQYKIIKNGTGKMPKATDTVVTHYRGNLINGTEFDSSIKRGQPASFAVNGVIKGWTEALQLMKEGSKWQLFVPSELAYGERGAGAAIGPNAVLIFEVELISIKDK